MDFNNLKDAVSNLTLYDIKANVRKVQNAVMNYTEMEAKVREATNNEPWGASSTLMQEIANGTHNYQTLNEIMPMVYRRFTEKSAEEWRQIYKSLQLLEFLIKHGSERVIDDARSHLTLLKMLRQFHFIDANGKDQGINVRNRAKELAELLGDVDRIRAERKKARANKGKYTGVGNTTMGGIGSSSSRYGGFGSDSAGGGSGGNGGYGGYSGGVYGDGGGFGGESTYNESGGMSATRSGGGSTAERFEEYDEYDEGESKASRSAGGSRTGTKRTTGGTPSKKTASSKPAAPPKAAKAKAPEVDLFSFDEPAPSTTTPAAAANDDDDFDDFQSAPSAPAAAPAAAPSNAFGGLGSLGGLGALSTPPLTTSNASGAQFAAPQPVSAPKQASLTDMVGISSISPPPASGANYSAFHAPPIAAAIAPQQTPQQQQQRAASGYQPAQPNYYQSVVAQQPGQASQAIKSVFPSSSSSSAFGSAAATPSAGGMAALRPAQASAPAAAPKASGDAFGSLWSTASTGIKKAPTGGPNVSMGQLAQEKSQAAIWGAPASSSSTPASKPAPSGGLDDLLG